MRVHMKEDERTALAQALGDARGYTEFGCGGSTVLASSLVRGPIVSVDSSQEWLQRVGHACAAVVGGVRPTLIYADIGPTGEWGSPKDESHRGSWPLYALAAWTASHAAKADVFLVDGRFRVACALETLLRCKPGAQIFVHDYAPRPEYHILEDYCETVAVISDMTVFRRKSLFDWTAAVQMLDRARYLPG